MGNEIRILIACEESDEVRGRFEQMGFDAWSCDLQENRNPNAKHYQGDVFDIINDNWDAMIAFPPCTHLAVSGAAWFEQKRKDGRQQQGIDFFLEIARAKIKHIAIENPVGIMSKIYMPPTQVIQPYYFGDKAQKTTCLWLKNLPLLYHNAAPNLFDDVVTHTDKGEFFEWIDSKTGKKKRQPLWFKEARSLKGDERSKVRSKTFPGIAQAMASQWGNYLMETYRSHYA
jgi:site-specific DNA-cytosine methylase